VVCGGGVGWGVSGGGGGGGLGWGWVLCGTKGKGGRGIVHY